MAIDIPRIVPVHTPVNVADEEALRVRRAASAERATAAEANARVERRLRPERRRNPDGRPRSMDLRSGDRRRSGARVDVEA